MRQVNHELPERLLRRALKFWREHRKLILVCGGTAVLFYLGSAAVKIVVCAGVAYLIVKIGELVYKFRLAD